MSSLLIFNFLYGATTVVGSALIITILTWIVKYQGGLGLSDELEFNWHPFLMVLGLVFFYSQAALIYRAGRYRTSKKVQKIAHTVIHLVSFTCSVIGLVAVFNNHNKAGRPNLYSLHSWLGLITVIIFAAQFLYGFIAFLYPGLAVSVRIKTMPLHYFFGVAIFVLAIITAIAGVTEMTAWTTDYALLTPEAYLLNFMGLFAALLGVLTLYLVLKPEYKRIPLAED